MYVPLDVNFPDDEKIEAVGLAGSGLYAQALCIAKRTLSDGRVSMVKLYRLGADAALIDLCVRADLFRVRADDPDAVWITAFLGHNEDADTVAAKRSSDAQRKRAARRKRPRNVQADAQGASENVQCLEIEVETEVEVEADTPTQVSELLTTGTAAPALDVEQATNRAVGMLANLRAIGGDNPGALAAHIGRTLPDHERVELGELIAAGMEPADAAAALADPLRGLQAVPGGRHDPAAVQAAADRAKRAEEATRARLDASTVHAPTRPPAGLRDALNGATS